MRVKYVTPPLVFLPDETKSLAAGLFKFSIGCIKLLLNYVNIIISDMSSIFV